MARLMEELNEDKDDGENKKRKRASFDSLDEDALSDRDDDRVF